MVCSQFRIKCRCHETDIIPALLKDGRTRKNVEQPGKYDIFYVANILKNIEWKRRTKKKITVCIPSTKKQPQREGSESGEYC